ncbi:MAG TPA: ligase-associated DNA damage response endonuclease PdeM [Cyclobacteriaceae bacterium]|nr:ligase-associated DNA damage response endonuclease PdeM [Cyclobacteriaceae bacterium]
MELRIRNNTFLLLPQKAMYWKEQRTVLLSDLHIGKIAHFRKGGIAVPQEGIQNNFKRLDEVIAATNPANLIFIGDLFHSDMNNEWSQFCTWRKQYPGIKMDMVLGNHDRLPDDFCHHYQINIYPEELVIEPFTFAHHPREAFADEEYIISGHVHPVVHLRGIARQSTTVPCFYFGTQQAILPSFGYFTGGYTIDVRDNDTVVAIAQNKLFAVQVRPEFAAAGV